MMKTKIKMIVIALAIVSSTTTLMAQTAWTVAAPYVWTNYTPTVGGGVRSGDLSPHSLDTITIGIHYQNNAFVGITEFQNSYPTRNAVFGTTQEISDILFVNKVGSTYDYYERMRINRFGRVGIGTPAPDTSALLHVNANNKGVLIPNVALDSVTDGLSVVLPANSLLVYNTGAGGLSPAGYYYNAGTSSAPNWVHFGTSTGWDIVGNVSTTASTAAYGNTVNNNFIGTTDDKDWVMATNNLERARIKANGNVGIGTSSPTNLADVYNTDGSKEALNVKSVVSSVVAGGATFRVDASPTPTSDLTNYASSIITLRNKGTQSNSNTLLGVSSLQVLAFNNATGGTLNNFSAINLNNTNTSTGNVTNMMSVYTRTATNTGAGTVTNFYGNRVLEQTIGSTLNIGYASEIASGTGRYNCYMNGTADNYFAGDVGIGTTNPDITGNGSAYRTLSVLGPNTSAYSCGILELATKSTDADANLAGVVNFTASANAATKQSIAQITAWTQGASSTNRGGLLTFTTKPNGSTSTVERMRITNAGDVGIGLTNPAYKLEVTGSFNVNGVATCTAGAWGSDQMFKTDIDSLQNALAIIHQLKPKSYYFDTTNVWGLNFPTKKQYGFVAQELEQVLPELVTSVIKNAVVDTAGNVINPATNYKAVYYLELIALLTKGIQEQEQKIDSLQTKTTNQDVANSGLQEQVNQLQNQVNQLVANGTSTQDQLNQLLSAVNNCCSATRSMHIGSTDTELQPLQQMDVKLNDVQSIVLEQNVPNPFAEQTTINYTLPDNTGKAQMLFYNSNGKLIQSTELIQKGKGQLNVFASDLSSGIYTYTLVVDGKVVETKKMIKQ